MNAIPNPHLYSTLDPSSTFYPLTPALHLWPILPTQKLQIDRRPNKLIGNSRRRRQPQRPLLILRPRPRAQDTRARP